MKNAPMAQKFCDQRRKTTFATQSANSGLSVKDWAMETTRPDQWKFLDFSGHHSKMNVTSSVTRYSVILPFSTLPFSELTSNPVTPRNVLVARFKPSSAASWKLFVDEAVILLTLATAMTRLLYGVSAMAG
jgi:hypothetical protein